MAGETASNATAGEQAGLHDMKDLRGPLLTALRYRLGDDHVGFCGIGIDALAITCAMFEVAASNDRIAAEISRLRKSLAAARDAKKPQPENRED